MKYRISARDCSPGSSLIELLTAMAIFSMIMGILTMTLQGALVSFRNGSDRTENVLGNQAALQWIKRDLESAFSARPANLPQLPESISDEQREFFENKIFFPIEINRTQGDGTFQSSFANAHPGFSSIAFVSRSSASSADLLGYYVAYTDNSPLAGFRNYSSMKLHRHFRSGSGIRANGYADGFLLHLSHEINDAVDEFSEGGVRPLEKANPAAVRMGNFSNGDLPFLFSHLIKDPGKLLAIPATQPWPVDPVSSLLKSPPPSLNPDRGTDADWKDPKNEIHDIVFPDESIARNIVRFEIKSYRRVRLKDGTFQIMDAAALSQHLGLKNGGEWPCLVKPGFVDITLGMIREQAARQLKTPADWIVDWSKTDPAEWSKTRKLIEKNLHTFHRRISLQRGI